MLVVAVFILVLACPCQGFPEQQTDTATIKHEPLEELLNRQEAKWASMLKEQEAKWTSILKQETADWVSALKEQDNRLTSQLRQQEKKLLAQQNLLRLQAEKLSHQESLLQEQAAELSSLRALLRQKDNTIQQLRHRHFQQKTFVEKNVGHYAMTSHHEKETSGSTFHDVMPRSDDAGAWEAVVSHLSQQMTEMGADMQTLKNSQTQQELAIQDAQSSTFVHWGSSTCTNLSHTVYSGVVGGSWYAHTGAATNYLCLTMSPVLSDHTLPGSIAYLYGGEYQTYDSHNQKNPVCAVCRSTLSTTVMIPGTNVCTPGWHLQYSGFLMAGWNGASAGSEYICVDSSLEDFPGTDASEDGKLLYFTVTYCGSLPCSPYVNNKVVTCSVCAR